MSILSLDFYWLLLASDSIFHLFCLIKYIDNKGHQAITELKQSREGTPALSEVQGAELVKLQGLQSLCSRQRLRPSGPYRSWWQRLRPLRP